MPDFKIGDRVRLGLQWDPHGSGKHPPVGTDGVLVPATASSDPLFCRYTMAWGALGTLLPVHGCEIEAVE